MWIRLDIVRLSFDGAVWEFADVVYYLRWAVFNRRCHQIPAPSVKPPKIKAVVAGSGMAAMATVVVAYLLPAPSTEISTHSRGSLLVEMKPMKEAILILGKIWDAPVLVVMVMSARSGAPSQSPPKNSPPKA